MRFFATPRNYVEEGGGFFATPTLVSARVGWRVSAKLLVSGVGGRWAAPRQKHLASEALTV